MRETKEFTTPGGRKVVLNAYLTGRESSSIQKSLYASLKVSAEDLRAGDIKLTENVPASVIVEQSEKALGFLLVSIDGVSENALEKLLDLPSSEYDAVVAEVNALANPLKPAK